MDAFLTIFIPFSGILPFTIPNDYRGIIATYVLGFFIAIVIIVWFLSLKYHNWKVFKRRKIKTYNFFAFPSFCQEKIQRIVSFKSWLWSIIEVSTEEIGEKSGQDVKLYLQMEIYFALFCSLVAILCVSIIIPINVTGDHYEEVICSL